jgi:hypothetical protein
MAISVPTGDASIVTGSSISPLQAFALLSDPRRDRAYTDLFSVPDLAVADSLYAGTAPVISTAQTTTPQTGFIKYAPDPVVLTGTDIRGPFSYPGAGNFQVGTVSPDTNYALPTSKYPNTYASGQGTWSVEFDTDAQTFQVRTKNINGSNTYRLSIDGRKVTDLMQSANTTGSGAGNLVTFDLGSAVPRRIRFDFATFPFGGVYIPPTRRIWGVPVPGRRVGVLGDSISDGSTQNAGAGCGTWVDRYARLMGYPDIWRQGRGGTGYITAGSFATFQTRATLDILPWAFDDLIIWGGYNDSAGSQSEVAAAANLLYATIQSALRNCKMIVMGCWSPTGSPGTGQVNTNVTLRAAALNNGLPFIDVQSGEVRDTAGTVIASQGQWITGTGNTGAPTGTGNADLYIGPDGVHPNDAGHLYLSRRVYEARLALLARGV